MRYDTYVNCRKKIVFLLVYRSYREVKLKINTFVINCNLSSKANHDTCLHMKHENSICRNRYIHIITIIKPVI